MTRTFVLSLALSLALGSFALSAPHAQACGGEYGFRAAPIDHDRLAVIGAALRFGAARVGERSPIEMMSWLRGIRIDGDQAVVEVYPQTDLGFRVRLARTADGWRVSRWRRLWEPRTSA